MKLKIVSGGQTGADRAALDWAIDNGVPHGGWCPRGRKAEDGPLDDRYELIETPTEEYPQRTEWNARDSDATAVFSIQQELSGGTLFTTEMAEKYGKPLIRLCQQDWQSDHARRLRSFLKDHDIRVLNVAGPRASNEPGIYQFVRSVLDQALGGSE
jgi:hypothetical protein